MFDLIGKQQFGNGYRIPVHIAVCFLMLRNWLKSWRSRHLEWYYAPTAVPEASVTALDVVHQSVALHAKESIWECWPFAILHNSKVSIVVFQFCVGCVVFKVHIMLQADKRYLAEAGSELMVWDGKLHRFTWLRVKIRDPPKPNQNDHRPIF